MKKVLVVDRPFAFTFMCYNRPYLSVHYVENGFNRYLGKILHEFSLYEIIFMVFFIL
jgi:hypothetical protein